MVSRAAGQRLKEHRPGIVAEKLDISGVVQGVGFRPHVYRLAHEIGLTGWVRNTGAGVEIQIEGPGALIDRFCTALRSQAPPLAHISSFKRSQCQPGEFPEFRILSSQSSAPGALQISPDVATCEDCLHELFDPSDRRARYPFINCTNCGPRFTIISGLPYDRPATSMAEFAMCLDCRAEYADPLDRRFHAQPVACPVCGPRVWLETAGVMLDSGEAAIKTARQALAAGDIVAVKGLGGFHLACDASNSKAVARLRDLKHRRSKALAVMVRDIASVRSLCKLTDNDEQLLRDASRPILILERLPGAELSPLISPDRATLGVMLAYTPLHALLLEEGPGFPSALVMTSGNLPSLPIAASNREARDTLSTLADLLLIHDRDIVIRCDDSVLLSTGEDSIPIRRARGMAPLPLPLPVEGPAILAVGGELKNTFALTRDQQAFVSQHIGDLKSYESFRSFSAAIDHLGSVLSIEPTILACDLHPDYLSTRYALDHSDESERIAVQHHHAHIASLMAEHNLPVGETVIGVAFDGTGYGTDGAVWGGEFMAAGYREFERLIHLNYVPMPGGDTAIREPWRMAISWMLAAELAIADDLKPVADVGPRRTDLLRRQIQSGLNCVPTSSMGRLFDAASSILGICHHAEYEAQAAIRLESAIDPGSSGEYSFTIEDGILDMRPLIVDLLADLKGGIDPGVIAARFHRTVAQAVLEGCRTIRDSHGLDLVGLSGGVWQNVALLELAKPLLEGNGFRVLIHQQVPPNDGGISYGQAACAAANLARRSTGGNSNETPLVLEQERV